MLNSYNKRIIRSRARREAAARVETRNGVLVDILQNLRKCRVRVQGSKKLIIAWFPETWGQMEPWMKIGSGVRIQHVSGNRNRTEVVGPSTVIPTPEPDGSDVIIGDGEDTVISGCGIYAYLDEQIMQVWVEVGVYRIAGDYYSLGELVIDENTVLTLQSGVTLGTIHTALEIPPAHATGFCMDAICVGTDKVVKVIQGVPSETDPVLPELPAGNLLLGWVLVPPEATKIVQEWINYPFVEPFVAKMNTSVADNQLYWDEDSTTIEVAVQDQYGRDIVGTNWHITAEIVRGTGTVTASAYTGTGDAMATFTYRRIANYQDTTNVTEEGPVVIKFTLQQKSGIFQQDVIELYDIYARFII